MESKIRISVDFENGNQPFIELIKAKSDDVRDNLVAAFLESFPNHNRWSKIVYAGQTREDGPQHYKIVPIPQEELAEEMKLMKAWLDHNQRVLKATEPTV